MIEDKLLIWKFQRGSPEALRRIYQKYETYLLTIATALLNDVNTAEDMVQDLFVSFAQSADKLKLNGSLKSYLATCLVNRTRDEFRARSRRPDGLADIPLSPSPLKGPSSKAQCNEEIIIVSAALAQLPREQREVIMLHLKGQMMFTQIAKIQNISVNTVRSRYRYGLNKLRSILNSENSK